MSGMGIDIDIIFFFFCVGLIVAFIHTILDQVGKKEYSQWVILVSFIYILFNVAQVVGQLIDRIKSVFLFQ